MANNPQPAGMQPVLPRIVSHVPPPNPIPPMSMQYRPMVPPPPPQSFVQVAPQQFQPGAMPPHPPPLQYPQAVPPLPSQQPPPSQPPPQRPGLSGHGLPQGHPQQLQFSNNYMPSYGGPRTSHIPYNLSSSSGGQQQMNVAPNLNDAANFPAGVQSWFPTGNQDMQSALPMQQTVEQSGGEQAWFSSGTQNIKPVTPLQQNGEANSAGQQWFPDGNHNSQSATPQPSEEQSAGVGNNTMPDTDKKASSDWREHTTRAGKKYFYNKRTRVSSWEKPWELMNPTERADASTDWREFTSPEGRRFYFNKVTKQSKWRMPDEVRLSRERMNLTPHQETPTVRDANSFASVELSTSGNEASTPNTDNLPVLAQEVLVSSPISVTPAVNPELAVTSELSRTQEEDTANIASDDTVPQEVAASAVVSDTPVRTATPIAITSPVGVSDISPQEAAPSAVKTPTGISDEENRGPISGGINTPDGKKLDPVPAVYESKEEAKSAFKALLESANVGSDWTWEQAMRVIINDRRYGALRPLSERKQTFNEFVGQKKKHEAEERRSRQKKARQDYKKMLQESKDLTSSTRWSKALSLFENDDRFQAIERAKDREDIFDEHLEELKKKERAKALEEHKRHKLEYLEFLKSCDFIKASSQWRKVQHRVEADERCLRLEKIERLEIFQEYIRDLEQEEEEQRKLRMEEQRKSERKNRDEFRKLMEEHVASGILTANTNWRDYCVKVKDAPAYLAVFANTSGFTAKDLFDDVIDDLEKQYLEDKERIEEAMKNEKVSLSLTWSFEDFKNALSKGLSSKPISYINQKLAFDELLEIAKEKEEKEAKKRKRLTEDVYDFIFTSKDITSSSKWEDFKSLVEDRFVGEESFFQEIFHKVILDLKEKTKEKERKRREEKAKKERKDKERKEKSRRSKDRGGGSRKAKERRKIDETDTDGSDSYSLEETKKSRDRSKKHRKRHLDSFDDTSLDDDEKERPRSHRYTADSKKSKQVEKQLSNVEADMENQSKKQKRDSGDGSSRNYDAEERTIGEHGEDGEVQ